MPAATQAQDWIVLPYNSKKIEDHYLVSNFLGNWEFLTREEFKQLEQFRIEEDGALYERLYTRGIIADKANIPGLISGYRNLNANQFSDVKLHIAVVTTRCNIECTYCHAATDTPSDMTKETASKIVPFLLNTRSSHVTLELQGGEPLLNWEVVKFLVKSVRDINAPNKTITILMITNGILLKEDRLNFLLDHDVKICISLDGPKHLHDNHRVFGKGAGSYDLVTQAIQRIQDAYKKRGINRPVDLMPTISRQNLPHIKEIIDEHVKWGTQMIALRWINKVGAADKEWDKIGCPADDFNQSWAEGMDYILELNQKGVMIRERMAYVLLKKIIGKQDPWYVDLMSPSGAGRSVLAYSPNGDIYPTDEARMLEDEIFKLGNVFKDEYDAVVKSPKLFPLSQSSVMDLWSYNDVYFPWLGTCIVMNYKTQGGLIPKITQTPSHKVQHFQFNYLFTKILKDDKVRKIFEEWVKGV